MKITSKLKRNINGYVITWLLCTALCFVVENVFATEKFYYDSWDYWNRGARYWEWTENGSFLFVSSDGSRGYVFPLFLGICNHFTGVIGWKIFNAMIISTLFTIIVPYLFGYRNNTNKIDYRAIIHYVIFTVLFIGLEIYPLSDLPAIFLCGLATFEILRMSKTEGIKRFLHSILSGILIYCAYNVRTIYLFGGVYLLCYLAYLLYKYRTNIRNMVLTVLGGGIGLLIAAIPQIYMNYCVYNRITAKVPTGGLMQAQLYWGMKYQNFAGYIGDNNALKSTLYFMDNVGENILQKEAIAEGASIGQYFKICLKYPLEMISIYVRHFINGILLYGPEIYIDDLERGKVLISLISFSCFFCFLLIIFIGCIKDRKTLWNFAPIIIPVLCIVPGAIESRFFAALYIFIIGTIVYNCDWQKLTIIVKKNKVKICACYLLLYACFLVVWTSMFASLDAEYALFFTRI